MFARTSSGARRARRLLDWRAALVYTHRQKPAAAGVMTVEQLRAGHAAFARSFTPKAMRMARIAGEHYWVAESAWLTAYDGYYYDARGADPLPVLRIRYADPQETWLYLDPGTGGVVQRSEKVTRLRRWLYQGFHSLDFPFLYYRRPLWDITVIALSVGGVALSVTTMAPAWQRLARHGRLWRGRRVQHG